MTDRIKLTREETEFAAGFLTNKFSTNPFSAADEVVRRLVSEINTRREDRAAEIRSATAGPYTEQPRGVIAPYMWNFKGSDELRAKIEYAQTFKQREDNLRIEALRLAVSTSGRFASDTAAEFANDAETFYKFLSGETS